MHIDYLIPSFVLSDARVTLPTKWCPRCCSLPLRDLRRNGPRIICPEDFGMYGLLRLMNDLPSNVSESSDHEFGSNAATHNVVLEVSSDEEEDDDVNADEKC